MGNATERPLTFLFTDIEGSTRLWEGHPVEMKVALERHDALLRSAIEAHGGRVFKTVGDAFCAVFDSPLGAVLAAIAIHRALQGEEWNELGAVRVRIAVHAGLVQQREGDYFGLPLHRITRLLAAGHGQETLLSQAAFELVDGELPAGVALRDLGDHRLRDLTRPEHVYQLVSADLPSEFPPLRTLDLHPNNLPSQATPLIGREKEIASALALLRDAGVHLVTFAGPGGTGKTHLALQVAAELIEDFRDGVFLVDLAPIIDAGLVLGTIARTLGVNEAASPRTSIGDRLKEFLHDKEMLLLLDNFEQVADAGPELSMLLRSAPSVKMLVTSRVALQLYGEHEFHVPPLSLPDEGEALPVGELLRYEAIRLFVERAQAVRFDFALTGDNAAAVTAVCRRLDGLPLAIELAAARVRLLSPGALQERLQSSESGRAQGGGGGAGGFKLLSSTLKDVPARQQTLHATMQWSYDLLSEAEQRLFRRMAVFKGGRTLEALEAVVGGTTSSTGSDPLPALGIEVLEGTESLVAKSLLQTREGRTGEPRFWMLETIHEFAREKLEESGEGGQLRRQHALYFCEVAEVGQVALDGPEQGHWLRRLEDEHDNMRTALEWASGEAGEGDPEPGLRLAGALWRFWFLHGHFSEGRRWLDTMLSVVPYPDVKQQPQVASLYASVLNGKGVISEQLGDYAMAIACFQQAIPIERALGERRKVGVSLYNLGSVFFDQGNTAEAKGCYEQSLVILREVGDKASTAAVLSGLGVAAYEQADYAKALAFFEEALSIERKLGDRYLLSSALNNLGCVSLVQGDYEVAERYLGESLLILRELGVKQDVAHTLNNLAVVAGRRSNVEEAQRLCLEGLSLRHEMGERLGIAESLDTMAWLLSGLPNVDEAEMGRAARLWGAAAGLREAMGAALPAEERDLYDEGESSARSLLGDSRFEACQIAGRAMSLGQAIEEADHAVRASMAGT